METVVEAGPAKSDVPLTDQPVEPTLHALAGAMIANQEAVLAKRF